MRNCPCDTTYNAMDFNSILHHMIPLKIHCENKISKRQDRVESKYRYRNAIIKIPIGQKTYGKVTCKHTPNFTLNVIAWHVHVTSYKVKYQAKSYAKPF